MACDDGTLFKYYYCTNYIPATNGPIIIGIELRPRINPMACDTPRGPQICTAIGPIIVEKQPSNKPITSENTIRDTYAYDPKKGAVVSNIVQQPIKMKASCCRNIGLTLGRLATNPNISFPIPDVMAIHVKIVSALLLGKISLTYATM